MHTNTPHVLIAPAMGLLAKFYRPLIDAFSAHRWSATVVPRRGIEPGSTPPTRRTDWSYADEAADLAAAVVEARDAVPTRPVLVLGHSVGAQLCTFLVGQDADGAACPDGVVTVAGSVPHARHYPGSRLSMYLTAEAVPVVSTVVGYWPKPFFGGPTPRTLMRQWAGMVRSGRTPFPATGADGPPVLAVRLADDALVPAAAADLLERCFDSESLSVWTYSPDLCPPGGSIDHVRWVRTPGPVVDRVIQWWSDVPADHSSVSV